MAQSPNFLSEILTELRGLRTDLRTPHRSQPSAPLKPRRPTRPATSSTPSRTLLKSIADTPLSTTICWYHKQHGIATQSRNCPGKPLCHYDLDNEIAKLQTLIAKVSKPSKQPAQDRLIHTRNLPTSTVSPPIINGHNIQPPELAMDTQSNAILTSNPTAPNMKTEDWNNLEDDLLMSASEHSE